jgi:hypothetical protein
MLCAAGGTLVTACILIDPPPELPRLPRTRPNIVQDAVQPPVSRVLLEWPTAFVVPVETLEANTPFVWSFFVDYDPVTNREPFLGLGNQRETTNDEGWRAVSFTVARPDPASCHVLEFVTARSFAANSSRAPDSAGADVTTWFYNPSGDPAGCPGFDAGAPADASTDVTTDTVLVPDTGGGG